MNFAFIIGCAKSGTSILGELIASHPDVNYLFEAHQIWEMIGLGENQSHRLTEEHATPDVMKSVRDQFMIQQGSAALTVEKNPRNVLRIPYITRIFPEAKIVHIVRGGCDVTCSLLPGIGGTEWQHLKPPTWKRLMDKEPVVRCAMAWRDAMQIALDDLETIPNLMIKYEDLVFSTEETAATVLDYLGLKNHASVKEFCTKIQNSTRDSYHAQSQLTWYRNNHTVRVGRWRQNLNPEQQGIVRKILQETLTRLDYPIYRPDCSSQ